MNEQRFVVSDVLWQRLEPHLPGKVSDAGAVIPPFYMTTDKTEIRK